MCIRDRLYKDGGDGIINPLDPITHEPTGDDVIAYTNATSCLLYTSDAADDLLCVDLGGRRIIQKKKSPHLSHISQTMSQLHQLPP